MDLKEAYKNLDVAENISDDDLKAQYKKLALKYHPDRNKDEPDKFKSINEAYQLIQDHRQHPEKYAPPPFNNGFFNVDIQDIFNNFGFGKQQKEKTFNFKPIEIDLKLSFKESILGCDREVKYNRFIKCDGCDGKGAESISNGCQACDGFGRITSQQRGMIFNTSCNKCLGKNIKSKTCDKCTTKGVLSVELSGNIQVPPGIANGTTLRLHGMGHFGGRSMFGDQYSDAFAHIHVDSEKNMTLSGNDVISNMNISLLEALTGCKKTVQTVYGDEEISISARIQNKDEIKLAGKGVKNANGNHRVIVNVEYPKNTDMLINVLKDLGED